VRWYYLYLLDYCGRDCKVKLASMTAVEWDEVKRLAADFQRAQLSSTVQRLYSNLLRITTSVNCYKISLTCPFRIAIAYVP
jgi:hypothetical protein